MNYLPSGWEAYLSAQLTTRSTNSSMGTGSVLGLWNLNLARMAVSPDRQQFCVPKKVMPCAWWLRKTKKWWEIGTLSLMKFWLRSMRFLISWTAKMFVVGIGLMNQMCSGVSSCKGCPSTQTKPRCLSSFKASAFPSRTSPSISKTVRILATRSWSYAQIQTKDVPFKSWTERRLANDGWGLVPLTAKDTSSKTNTDW